MERPVPSPDAPEVQDVLAELARRTPRLEHHVGARGQGRHPYVSGVIEAAGDAHLEVCRSVRWHEQGVSLWMGAGPFGAWAKPIRPDVDQQEGGLLFLPDTPGVHAGGFLLEHPEAQADLHRIWLGARWEDDEGRAHDGVVLLVRPDAVIAHVHTRAATLDVLETALRHLPAVAAAALEHDAEWSETVHPPADQVLWPTLWVLLVAIVVIVAYLVVR